MQRFSKFFISFEKQIISNNKILIEHGNFFNFGNRKKSRGNKSRKYNSCNFALTTVDVWEDPGGRELFAPQSWSFFLPFVFQTT